MLRKKLAVQSGGWYIGRGQESKREKGAVFLGRVPVLLESGCA